MPMERFNGAKRLLIEAYEKYFDEIIHQAMFLDKDVLEIIFNE